MIVASIATLISNSNSSNPKGPNPCPIIPTKLGKNLESKLIRLCDYPTAIHNLTDVCFKKCVTSKISAGKLDRYEEPCMQNCVDRFLDANKLILGQLDGMRGS